MLVNHSTPADASFSEEGAAAWEDEHIVSLGDDENFVTDLEKVAIAAIAGKENTGVAAGLVSLHESAPNPHPQYLQDYIETDPVFAASEAAQFASGDKSKLDGIDAGAQVNTVASVNSKTGTVVLGISDILPVTHQIAVLDGGLGSSPETAYEMTGLDNNGDHYDVLVVDMTGCSGNAYIQKSATMPVGDYRITSIAAQASIIINSGVGFNGYSISGTWTSGINYGYEFNAGGVPEARFYVEPQYNRIIPTNNWEKTFNVDWNGDRDLNEGYESRHTLNQSSYDRLSKLIVEPDYVGTEIPSLHDFTPDTPSKGQYYLQSNGDLYLYNGSSWDFEGNIKYIGTADSVFFDNTASGLVATNVQAALLELNVNASYLGFHDYTAPTVSANHFTLVESLVTFPAGGVASDYNVEAILPATTELDAIPNSTNIIYADWNGGSPEWGVTANKADIDYLSKIPYARMYVRDGSGTAHTMPMTQLSLNTPDRAERRAFEVDEYGRASGLMINAVGGYVEITEGVVYVGFDRLQLEEIPLGLHDGYFDCVYMGTVAAWNSGTTYRKGQGCTYGGTTYVSLQDTNLNQQPDTATTYWSSRTEPLTGWGTYRKGSVDPEVDNSHYADATGGLQPLTTDYYNVCWYYRGVESETHVYRIIGDVEYENAEAAATASKPSILPELISSHAMLIGRVITKQGTTTHVTLSEFTSRSSSTATISQHNQTTNKDGGEPGFYGHLTSAELGQVQDANRMRKITYGTGDPTGGSDGDIYIKYTA